MVVGEPLTFSVGPGHSCGRVPKTVGTKRTITAAFAGALALGCGSHQDLGSDPQWGEGFSTRLADAGNPDAPTSVAQACAFFGGEPYVYPSLDELQARLSRRWVGCANYAGDTGFWPAGFTGVQLDADGTWQALVRASDGSVQPATEGNATGTYDVTLYMPGSAQYAPMFVMHFLPVGGTDPFASEQWEGNIEESPEILFVVSSNTADSYRFSSALP